MEIFQGNTATIINVQRPSDVVMNDIKIKLLNSKLNRIRKLINQLRNDYVFMSQREKRANQELIMGQLLRQTTPLKIMIGKLENQNVKLLSPITSPIFKQIESTFNLK